MRSVAPASPAPAPATVVLAPHRSLLRRGPASRLLGLDPGTAIAADGLPAGLAEMLDDLVSPVDRDVLIARSARRGASAEEAGELLRQLVAAGAVVDATAQRRIARHRTVATVLVRGDGPLAVGIAAGLGQAGVGAVHVAADGVVLAADLGTGYLDDDRGRGRAEAAAEAICRLAPGVRTGALPARTAADLVVLTDALAVDGATARGLVDRGALHLQVRVRDGLGIVGPLVLPARSACLHCLELHRAERDPGWPAVAAQLVGRPGRAAPHCVLATVGLGVAQALAALDGPAAGARAPCAVDATLELDADAGRLVRRPWTPHPGCGCGASRRPPEPGSGSGQPNATCGLPDRQETITE
ncbi:ThiF family adenylyltransferase [Pseudonocardia sp. H11422]|uniref:ThiF family adenylyltransferase n=1 Tax=Pseudonocardia sp. H11422 TaxID=2835866 RepID=UPI001BDD9AB6|nr:ThiF family adenylyltransferase [Pseudonocardia sp. H11422]